MISPTYWTYLPIGFCSLMMNKAKFYEQRLRREREKLGRLIDAAMDEPIALNEAILAQSRVVDGLVALLQGAGEGEDREEGGGSRPPGLSMTENG